MAKSQPLVLLLTALPVAALPLVLACAANKPEPASPEADSTQTPATSIDAGQATETAPTPSASAPVPAAPVAPATPEPPAKAPFVLGETKDDCTPVGVDFEKRARPKLKECYAEGKKKAPTLEGTVKIKVVVDVKGKIKSTKVIEKTLPDAVANCMLNVIKTTPFPEVDKCWDATLTLPITFPTPK